MCVQQSFNMTSIPFPSPSPDGFHGSLSPCSRSVSRAAMKLENPRADSQLEFTVATEKEFDEILAMSKGIYGGLDYLPSRYHTWIREPNRTVVLAKKNGAVVRILGSRA